MLSTSDRGGIRIQYSKNPFGKKRDASGNWISTNENGSFAASTHDPNDAGEPPPRTTYPGCTCSTLCQHLCICVLDVAAAEEFDPYDSSWLPPVQASSFCSVSELAQNCRAELNV